MIAFQYPAGPHVRRHGPVGYKKYESYREWLRDEFVYRCVYCLHRERWNSRAASFHIEHFIPVTIDADGECEYSNLLYACGTCNTAKAAILGVPNPCEVAFDECLRVETNGTVTALNDDGERLNDVFRFNRAKDVESRARWIRTLVALETSHPDIFEDYLAFPEDLTDLRPPRTRAPENNNPNSVEHCFFALRERGDLPVTY